MTRQWHDRITLVELMLVGAVLGTLVMMALQ